MNILHILYIIGVYYEKIQFLVFRNPGCPVENVIENERTEFLGMHPAGT